MMDFTLK